MEINAIAEAQIVDSHYHGLCGDADYFTLSLVNADEYKKNFNIDLVGCFGEFPLGTKVKIYIESVSTPAAPATLSAPDTPPTE